jgi:ASCH domain
MKALSIQQPWAWAIIYAGKNIENRTWNTHFRGTFAVHASGTLMRDAELPRRSLRPRPGELITDVGNDSYTIHTQLLGWHPELEVKRRWCALEVEDVGPKPIDMLRLIRTQGG